MNYIETVVTAANLRNGTLYFKHPPSGFFPADAYGSTPKHSAGKSVCVRANADTWQTDIVVKSSIHLRLRKRFYSIYKNLNVQVGDKVRLLRHAEREYEVIFV